MAIFVVIIAVIYIVLSVIVAKFPRFFFDASGQRMDGKRIRGNSLLVIAHPDDECMFFAPTVISFLKQRRGRERFLILCLSNGDYGRQLGGERQQEFFRAARVLGLHASDVTVTLSEHLKDGRDWSETLITNIVHLHCEKNAVKNIITFDEFGVSGHKNHISVFHAVKNVPGITLLALESVSIFRKYASVLDLPFSLMLNKVLPSKPWTEIICMTDREVAVSALYEHKSQMVWFRRLYALFSRYLFINTFQVYK